VVEKGRSVWVSGDPRGPSAAPQDDTLLKKVVEVQVQVQVWQQQQQQQEQEQEQEPMRGFFTAFRMTAVGGWVGCG
jgi:hypothetical protein